MTLIGLIFTVLGGLAGCGSFWYAYTADNRARREERRRTGRISHSQAQKHRLSSWHWINIVVSVAAICIFALGIFLITRPSGSSLPPVAGSTASSSISSATPSHTVTQPSSSLSSGWSEQFGPKPLLFTNGDSVNLDQVPPDVNGGSGNFQFTNNQLYDYNNLVKWTGTGTASAAACSDLINEQGVQYAKPVMRDTYCAKTDQGNIAILTVQRIDVDSTGNMTSVLVQTTVWTGSS